MPKKLGITRTLVDYLSEHQGEKLSMKQIDKEVLPRLIDAAGRPLTYKTVCNHMAKVCETFPCCFRVGHGEYVWDENEENWDKYSYVSNTDRLVKLLAEANKPLSYDDLMRELGVKYTTLLMMLTNAQASPDIEIKRYQVAELVSDKRRLTRS